MGALKCVCQRPFRFIPCVSPVFRLPASRNLHLSSSRSTTDTKSSDESPAPSIPPYEQAPEIDSENKTVKTVAGDLLLSPLMDPAFHEARQIFTKPKDKESHRCEKTRLRKRLARNPYARALATPARHCNVTKAVLPKFFLQGFKLALHPETGEPWLIPQNPANDVKVPDVARVKSSPGVTTGDGIVTWPEVRGGPTGYVLSRNGLLTEFATKGSPYYNKQKTLLRKSGHRSAHFAEYLDKAHWLDNVPSLLLEAMRHQLVNFLLYIAGLVEGADRKYLVRCDTWDDAKRYIQPGCLLFFGQSEGPDRPISEAMTLPQLSTMDLDSVRRGGKLPIHDMRILLGPENIARLRRESTLLHSGSLFLLSRERSVDLQLLLWKLQGYLDRPVSKPSEQPATLKNRWPYNLTYKHPIRVRGFGAKKS